MTNGEMLRIAMAQSAEDIGCMPEDFLKGEPVLVDGIVGKRARAYYKEPITCNFVSYGSNVVASVKPELRALVEEYVKKFPFYHLFETPNALWLHERAEKLGHKLCFMAEYFLPDTAHLQVLSCPLETRLLHPADFGSLYRDEWSNALCKDRRELDILGVGAYDGDALVGFAACSMDCEAMWQIGVDVLPAYRGRGIASALTSRLAMEIMARGKVPFYCCAWSNIPSAKNAIKSGFRPAWVELTVKPSLFVDGINA